MDLELLGDTLQARSMDRLQLERLHFSRTPIMAVMAR